MTRPVRLRSLQTIVPETVLEQSRVRDLFAAQPGLGRLAQRIIATSFDASGIDTRHTVLAELAGGIPDACFVDPETGMLRDPGTRMRNAVYTREAGRLFIDAARRALDDDGEINPADVTHVVTVSCTGFYAPGPDFEIVRALGLRDDVRRQHLGFMGCYAALPALRIARDFCLADADAVVLVVCAELCTLHLRSSEEPDSIVAMSLFADGAAAAIVTARPVLDENTGLVLDGFHTASIPQGRDEMAWTIGDHGFEMTLSPAVPQLIGAHIREALEPLYAEEPAISEAFRDGCVADGVAHWAIHPGGRSTVDRTATALGLDETHAAPARDVLRRFGNMSSATVLFVLREILDGAAKPGERVTAMAFGPGLTAETALMTVSPTVPA